MITTKYLSENYRLNIIDDSIATKILADLYLNLPKSEDELEKEFPSDNVKIKLAKLFKASLIEKNLNDLWSITYLGKLIMQRLNVASYAVDYQLKELDLKKTDYYFLYSCIKSQAYLDENYYNSISSYIKALKGLVQQEHHTKINKENIIKEALYTYIVGLDDNLNKIGIKEYPNFILSNLENLNIYNSKSIIVKLKRNIDYLRESCLFANEYIQTSNKFILNFDYSDIHNFIWPKESVRKITFLRYLNPIVNKEIDNAFYVICKYKSKPDTFNRIKYFSDEINHFENNFKTKLWVENKIEKSYFKVLDSYIQEKDNTYSKHYDFSKYLDNLIIAFDEDELSRWSDFELRKIKSKLEKLTKEINEELLSPTRGHKT